MDRAQPKRLNRRRETTRIALIEAAETLIGEQGVEGTSIRQIGQMIGSANPNVVGYHFGGKEALIVEIYRYRVPGLDAKRCARLAEIDASGQNVSIEVLMSVIWQPLFEQVNEAGKHSYAHFLGSIYRAGLVSTRALMNDEFPTTKQLSERISSQLTSIPEDILRWRWPMVAHLILSALWMIDQKPPKCAAEAQRNFDDAIAMATAALTVPILDS